MAEITENYRLKRLKPVPMGGKYWLKNEEKPANENLHLELIEIEVEPDREKARYL